MAFDTTFLPKNNPTSEQASGNPNFNNEFIKDIPKQDSVGAASSSLKSSISSPTPDYTPGGLTDPMGMILSAGKALAHGTDTVGTALMKIGAKIGGRPDIARAAQTIYNQNTDAYNKDPDTNAHPYVAGLGNLLGYANASGGLLTPAVSGVVKGALASGGLNALLGGFTPYQGQDPNEVFNTNNAITSGVLGTALGAAGGAVSSYANKVSNLENAYKNLNITVNGTPVQYTGKLADADLGQANPLTQWLGKQLSTNAMRQVPLLAADAPPTTGGSTYGQAMTNYISDYINAVAGPNGVSGARQAIANGITNTSKALKQTVNDLGNTALDEAEKVGKSFINFSSDTLDQLVAMKNEFGSYLGKETSNTLANMISNGGGDMNQLIGPGSILHDIYPSNLIAKGTKFRNNDDTNAMKGLLQSYTNIRNDLLQGLQDTSASEALHNFLGASEGMYQFKSTPGLQQAIQSVGEAKNGFNKFYNALLTGRQSPEMQAMGLFAAGPEGRSAATAASVNQMFQSSIDPQTGTMDVNSFLKKIQMQPEVKSQMNESTLDALSGMVGYLNNNNKAAQITFPGLAYIANNSPIKNALIKFNSASGNPGLSQYLMKGISKMLERSGAVFSPANNQGRASEDTSPIQTPSDTTPIDTTGVRE